jgi:serine/threonine protein kinase
MGGTADYMAPEQAVDLHSVTIAADLYSLGCTLYCLLAGRPPFGDERHPNLASKLIAHRQEPVPPIATFRPELAQRSDLLRLLDRMLAKAPPARPSEPRAVAEALAPLTLGHDLTKLFADGPSGSRDWPAARKRRRPRAVYYAAGVLLCLGLFAGWFGWAPVSRQLGAGPDRTKSGATAAAPTSSPDSRVPLRIESLEVDDYRGDPAQLHGTIGVLAHAAQFDDNVRVKARLSAPGYCYLIAMNPDGSVQVCPKDQEKVPPSRTSEIVFPGAADDYYALTDGAGLQAFVLIASRTPLPAFESWPARAGLPWSSTSEGESWQFNGRDFDFLGPATKHNPADRGEVRHVKTAPPAPFIAVCNYIKQLPGVDAIRATVFPVLPAETSNTAAAAPN